MLFRWALILLIFFSAPALAHDRWRNGDSIPDWIKTSCCGKADAHHLEPSQVQRFVGPTRFCPHCSAETDYYVVEGYSRPIGSQLAMPSEDGDYWVFYKENAYGEGVPSNVYCFFIPMAF